MTIRLALGHLEGFDDTVAAFAQQLGLTGVQFHTPSDLTGAPGYWELDELLALRDRCEAAGLIVEGIENVPYGHWDKVLRGLAGRDEQLENYRTTIRNMAAAGIFVLGHHFLPTYVWRTDLDARGRGGARVTAFDAARVDEGNALAGYKLTPGEPFHEAIGGERMWDNYRVFLEAVLPVAEEVGVRLALHPDDPPTDIPLGGVTRILTSPEDLERAYELSGGSPAWGLDLCLGTVSEMAGEESVNRVIDTFGPEGRIAYVHFRDVQGTVPRFQESFLGEGNYDPAAVLRRLRDRGFDGFIIDDHVPAMIGDEDTWANTASAAYCSRGRAHAIGYLQGLMHAEGL
jgi:mannonate dehydratase